MKKLLGIALVIGVISSTSLTPAVFAAVDVNALPSLDSKINADVTTSGSNMNIQITGGQGSVGTLNWNSYNVGSDASVNYEFSAHNQTALNKVNAAGGLSQIYGKITNSGCAGCGYEGTGKIILLNPNGVLFGQGANVDVNSFTVSTMDGTYDKNTKQLKLERTTSSPYGIIVDKDAVVHGDKNVTFATDNVTLYNGSKISTNVAPNAKNANGGLDSYGKVKIVTADGVNFTYYNNGAVSKVSGIVGAAEKMVVSADGALIDAGHIDIANYSSNTNSQINLNGAVLKATKAVTGNDGNIWLTAANKVVVDGADLKTVNYSDAASSNSGGDISIVAGQKVSVKNSTLNAVRDIESISQQGDSVVEASTLKADRDIRIISAKIASAQKSATLNAKNITINGAKRAQAVESTLTASEDVNIVSAGDMAWTNKATINAGKDINVNASNGYLTLSNSDLSAQKNVNLTSKDNVVSAKLAGSIIKAGQDVNVESTQESILLTSTSQFQPVGTLNLKAAKNVEIKTAGDLTTEKMNLTAGKDVKLASTEGNLNVKDTTKFLAAERIFLSGAKNVQTTNAVDMNNIQTNISAGDDVNVTLANVGNRQNGVVAQAGKNMTVTTDGTLSVSSLIAGNNMTINANKVIAGLPYTTEEKLNNDYERSYIKVGGEFTSNVATDNYEVTLSGAPTDDGKYNQKHHIQYGEDEKILLVQDRLRPIDSTNPTLPDVNDGDEADAINPDGTTDPTPNPGENEPTTPGEGENPNPNPNPNPGEGEGEDCDGDPAEDDTVENEDRGTLSTVSGVNTFAQALLNLSNYTSKSNVKKSL